MTLTASDTKALQQLPLFAPVPRAALKRLFDGARLHSFASDSILFRENESAEYLYVALDGHVALMASGAGEGDVIVEFVPPGHPFITAAVLLNRPFLMTARVIETTRVALLPAGDFRKAVAAEHSLSLSLNMVASEHWRLLIGQVKSLKMRTASQRLAAFLISLVDRYAGTATVTLPCERQVLASWLGMVPTSASRAFRDLAALGVHGRGRTLEIQSLERLSEFANVRPTSLVFRSWRGTQAAVTRALPQARRQAV